MKFYRKVTVSRDNYLGMMLDKRMRGKVYIVMIKNIKDMIRGLPEEIKSTAAMSASDHLFQIWNDQKISVT